MDLRIGSFGSCGLMWVRRGFWRQSSSLIREDDYSTSSGREQTASFPVEGLFF